jgi:hypothetical protein
MLSGGFFVRNTNDLSRGKAWIAASKTPRNVIVSPLCGISSLQITVKNGFQFHKDWRVKASLRGVFDAAIHLHVFMCGNKNGIDRYGFQVHADEVLPYPRKSPA